MLIPGRIAALQKSGEYDHILAQDLAQFGSVDSHQIRDAIDELKRSTASIEKHNDNLALQQNAMNSFLRNEERRIKARSQTSNSQLNQWAAERGHVSKAVGLPYSGIFRGLTYYI
jgi:hypothetical protein